MSRISKVEIGRWIEKKGENFLLRQGYRFISRNFRRKTGEIDLILEEILKNGQTELVIVETRCRARGSWFDGMSSVNTTKRNRIELTTRIFLMDYFGPAESLRFDILSWDGRNWTHMKNAW